MKKFFEIAKIQLAIMTSNTTKAGSGTLSSKILLFVIVASMIFASTVYSFGIYSSLPVGNKELVLYSMATVSVLIIFIFSITTAQGQLFQFRDFEMLMTWPISRTTVFLAKVISFVAIMLMYSILIMLPALLVYGYLQSMGILFYLLGVVGMFFNILIPITLSSMIAFFIRKVAGNGKYKNLFVNLGSIIMFGAIMIFSFSLSSVEETVISIDVVTNIIGYIKTYLYPIYLYVHSCITGNIFELLLSILINVVVFMVFVLVFSRTFVKINSTVQTGYKNKNFKLRKEGGKSPLLALCLKELSKFTSNMMYFMNMGMGQVMLVIGGVYLLLNKSLIMDGLKQFELLGFDILPTLFGLVCTAICLFAFMTPTAAVSISLEGKQFWITKTLPVSTETIFISKALANAIIIWLPSSIGFILISLGLGFTLLEIIMGLVLIFLMGILIGLLGVFININFPKLEFDREILVIKQSTSSFVAILGGMVVGALIVFAYINIAPAIGEYIFIMLLIIAILFINLGIWIYLKKIGVRKFYELY
ncbi:hypothetical protein [Anaerorhabdus sp.]|uniref:hypothetical protein n=1 Tax=Anaerorhabdus sp. TaxID=1872524 RepID=UPI002FC67EC7